MIIEMFGKNFSIVNNATVIDNIVKKNNPNDSLGLRILSTRTKIPTIAPKIALREKDNNRQISIIIVLINQRKFLCFNLVVRNIKTMGKIKIKYVANKFGFPKKLAKRNPSFQLFAETLIMSP